MGILDILKNKKKQKETLEEDNNIEKEELYSGKAYILCTERDLDKIMNVICNIFNINSSGNGNTIQIHNKDIKVNVTVFATSMGEEIQVFIKDQVQRTYGHFYEVKTEHIDIKTNLLYKLQQTCGFVNIEYSFIPEDGINKQFMIEEMFVRTLLELQGVILLPGKEDGLYCKGKDRAMELILSDGGNSSLIGYLPEQTFSMKAEDGQLEEEQINRRLKSRKIIEEKFIYVPVWYPLIETVKESKCRLPKEIAERAVALMIVSLYSECLLGENMNVNEAYEFVSEFIERFDAEKFLSPAEKSYLHNENSTQEEQIAYSWKYENLFVMEWALGLVDELGFPDHICDVPLTVRLLKNCNTIEEILQNSKPKRKETLLDECDLIFCLDWACVDTRIHNLPAPAGMNNGVVMERHKSLNWLIGYENSAEWDEVGTDT
ncbi:hypothetical protein BD780_001617 [Clostridium tetanomorphum]|uniref:DUF4272 domain-containing protein n=1 Tax=Clostridium tetanomorphum TaxID=1553 RepID=A0A923E7W7_CLOTT|nr:DUF4272 domain-containing protein [Clostridium tetanomorphum]KAJ52691.1 hypothetical protein CTM_06886 [Clostridium tetanomorphum DSM 665]MBC2396756.1 DUF4272 domain-containing protein [Clostridium tetanomorphum]MBP1863284.1 hypothetical protein [Clostridium tetanomorphum]NRS84392.1 hypothetical protein [Clostridium tetanomorphum]NRZ97607.1 hypothetical protein [Clostridium tetanomorphum]